MWLLLRQEGWHLHPAGLEVRYWSQTTLDNSPAMNRTRSSRQTPGSIAERFFATPLWSSIAARPEWRKCPGGRSLKLGVVDEHLAARAGQPRGMGGRRDVEVLAIQQRDKACGASRTQIAIHRRASSNQEEYLPQVRIARMTDLAQARCRLRGLDR